METIFPLFPSFLLPQHGWVGLCEGLLVSSTGRASHGPLWCSGMLVVDVVVTLGHRGAWAGCQAASALCPGWKNARPAQAWGNQLWVFARWGFVHPSVHPYGHSMHCLFILGRIKMVNS